MRLRLAVVECGGSRRRRSLSERLVAREKYLSRERLQSAIELRVCRHFSETDSSQVARMSHDIRAARAQVKLEMQIHSWK